MLTGMPGAGKSFWGEKWAALYDWQFVDLDGAIEAKAGKNIASVFKEKGEAFFREMETETLREIITGVRENTVLATGGGVVLSAINRKILSGYCTVWLKAPLQELAKRLLIETSMRPLLSGGGLREKLAEMLAEREPFYAAAPIHLDTSAITISTFQIVLQQCLKPH